MEGVVSMEYVLKLITSVLGGVLIFIFGSWHDLFVIFIALWFLDVITGMMAAGKKGRISSIKGTVGLAKKIGVFCLISTAHIADLLLNTGEVIRDSTLMWFVVNELISIIENAGRAGLPIPPKLQKAIEVLKEESTKTEKEKK